MDEVFEFDYRWTDHLKLKDMEDWELITNESWEEFNAYGGVPVYVDGKPVMTDKGILRKANMTCTVAFIFVLKRTQDPSWTLEQTRELPLHVLNTIMKSMASYFQSLVDDAKPKSEGTPKKRSTRQKPANNQA